MIQRIVRTTLCVHKTVPAALKWEKSGESLADEMVNKRTNRFLVLSDGAYNNQNENILKDVGFMIRSDVQMYHFTAIAMRCPPKLGVK